MKLITDYCRRLNNTCFHNVFDEMKKGMIEMARGILYVMSTAVPGLIKIGKTGSTQFEKRMNYLEKNGYSNVTALSRQFAIEVDDYDEKEILLHTIFSKSRIAQTELFAADLDLIIQLLSSFDGTEVYPKDRSKEEVFEEVSDKVVAEENEVRSECKNQGIIPDGIYTLSHKKKGFGQVEAKLHIHHGIITLKEGSICAPVKEHKYEKMRTGIDIKDNILQQDFVCSSVSIAGEIALGSSANGWTVWKNENGQPIDVYRKNS